MNRNKRFFLALLSSPALFASILSMVVVSQPAHGNQPVNSSKSSLSCLPNPHSATPSLKCIRVSQKIAAKPQVTTPQNAANYNPADIKELEFTEEESDAAVALFGCDCPSCLNALRKMRGQPLIPV